MPLGFCFINDCELLIYLCKILSSSLWQLKVICLNMLFLVLWAKWKGVQTAALLHGPVVKDRVSYFKSRGLVGCGYDR